MVKNPKLWKEVDEVYEVYLGRNILVHILKEEINRLEGYSKTLKTRTDILANDFARESKAVKADFNKLGRELEPVIAHAKVLLKKYKYDEAKAKEKSQAMRNKYLRETGERWDY